MSAGLLTPACVLVTGAEGFVGRWLMRAMRARLPSGARLVGACHVGPPAAEAEQVPEGWDRIGLDITIPEDCEAAVAALRPGCVVHLAAIAAVPETRRDPRRAWVVNLEGALNMARAVLWHAPGARFLFASTSEVYGGAFNARGRALDETVPLDPISPYGATKAAADLGIGQLVYEGLRAVRFRSFNHTGPGQGELFVVPAFAAQIARIEAGLQEPVLRVGNLEARRDFLDVRDVVEAYVRAALMPDDVEPGLILNLASGVPRRIGDVLDALVTSARCPIQVIPDPDRLRPSDTPLALGDAALARARLGWTPEVPWATTLADVLEEWRALVAR